MGWWDANTNNKRKTKMNEIDIPDWEEGKMRWTERQFKKKAQFKAMREMLIENPHRIWNQATFFLMLNEKLTSLYRFRTANQMIRTTKGFHSFMKVWRFYTIDEKGTRKEVYLPRSVYWDEEETLKNIKKYPTPLGRRPFQHERKKMEEKGISLHNILTRKDLTREDPKEFLFKERVKEVLERHFKNEAFKTVLSDIFEELEIEDED